MFLQPRYILLPWRMCRAPTAKRSPSIQFSSWAGTGPESERRRNHSSRLDSHQQDKLFGNHGRLRYSAEGNGSFVASHQSPKMPEKQAWYTQKQEGFICGEELKLTAWNKSVNVELHGIALRRCFSNDGIVCARDCAKSSCQLNLLMPIQWGARGWADRALNITTQINIVTKASRLAYQIKLSHCAVRLQSLG